MRPYISEKGAYSNGAKANVMRKMESVKDNSVSLVMPKSSAMNGRAGAMIELLRGVTNV